MVKSCKYCGNSFTLINNSIPYCSVECRFLSKLNIKEPDECWEYTKNKIKGGYGQFKINNEMLVAHRVMWQFIFGDIPDGIMILHRCDNPSCCNPNHLFIGTHTDNMNDRNLKNRQAKGINHAMAKFTEKHVLEIRSYFAQGCRVSDIAKFFDSKWNTIDHVCKRESWSHI